MEGAKGALSTPPESKYKKTGGKGDGGKNIPPFWGREFYFVPEKYCLVQS